MKTANTFLNHRHGENGRGYYELSREKNRGILAGEREIITPAQLVKGQAIMFSPSWDFGRGLNDGDVIQIEGLRLRVLSYDAFTYSYLCILEQDNSRLAAFRFAVARRWRWVKDRIILTFWVWGLADDPLNRYGLSWVQIRPVRQVLEFWRRICRR